MLRHPFSLKFDELLTQNLEFEEVLEEELAQQRRGGLLATTLAIGEEGGGWSIFPKPPGTVTTLAVGEEGGSFELPNFFDHPHATTLAIGEEG